MDQLSPSECLKAYATQYVSARGDVLIVQNGSILQPNFTRSDSTTEQFVPAYNGYALFYHKRIPFQSYPTQYPSYQWQCSVDIQEDRCSLNYSHTDIQSTWLPYGGQVQYCLSEHVLEQCELDFNVQFAILVIISNLAKVICMFLVVWRHDPSTLITLGDAIQSFINRPDPHTQGFCTVPDHLLAVLIRWASRAPQAMDALAPHDADVNLMQRKFMNEPRFREWRPPSRRWWSAPSISRWILCTFL